MTGTNTKKFVSSIKIKGLHFLPPVVSFITYFPIDIFKLFFQITEERRIELQKYKHQAIKLEKRLQHCRELERNLQGLLDLRPLSGQSQTSFSETSFNDTNSHLKALGISPRPSENPSNRSKNRINLSTDIIDITEYGSTGIKILDSRQNVINQSYEQGQHQNLNKSDTINLFLPTDNNNDCRVTGKLL